VSTIRFFGIICISATMYAQFSSGPGSRISGQLRSHGDAGSSDFLVELYDLRTNAMIERVPVSQGEFEFDHVPPGSFTVRVVTEPGGPPIVEEFHEFEPGSEPLVLQLPEISAAKPISGIVSLHQLEHPIDKKAIKEAYEAQQYERANNLPQAVAKLEKAIQISPQFRDAHLNLGVQYARLGRTADARAQFQKALDIGPPAAAIYADLSLTSLAVRDYREAETFARKALQLDPANSGAQRVLEYASAH
jgi:tetratricopeptide (TPR) repeat protein